jgi:hypothetical protein
MSTDFQVDSRIAIWGPQGRSGSFDEGEVLWRPQQRILGEAKSIYLRLKQEDRPDFLQILPERSGWVGVPQSTLIGDEGDENHTTH